MMTDYILEQKDSFMVYGIGTEIKDLANLRAEKAEFWKAIHQDERLDALQSLATNDYLFAVNEAVNNKMMVYAGVLIDGADSVTPLEESRIIPFPKGEYLVVKGKGKTADELHQQLEGQVFGQILPEAKHFAYVGGPNAIVEMGKHNGSIFGELWVPVVRK
jgi:predicted transcriptional regulator YdeE